MNEGIQLGVRQTSLFSPNESFILSEIIFFVKIANLSDYSTLNFKFSFCTHSYTEFSNSIDCIISNSILVVPVYCCYHST